MTDIQITQALRYPLTSLLTTICLVPNAFLECLLIMLQEKHLKYLDVRLFPFTHTHPYNLELGQLWAKKSQTVSSSSSLNVKGWGYTPECDIRENVHTNEYPNIFVLIFLTRTNVRISIRIENCMNIRIFV